LIPELDRYHGVVLRQIVIAAEHPLLIGIANLSGRVDAFRIERGAFQVKHSSKRLSPWQFTYLPENLSELEALEQQFDPVWVMLVCGVDGIVGLSSSELKSIIKIENGRATGIRVSRSRNAMYRVFGSLGELPRAKPRGVQAFISEVLSSPGEPPPE
jgi:hypothetical protein